MILDSVVIGIILGGGILAKFIFNVRRKAGKRFTFTPASFELDAGQSGSTVLTATLNGQVAPVTINSVISPNTNVIATRSGNTITFSVSSTPPIADEIVPVEIDAV